jgi:hypothetical protein
MQKELSGPRKQLRSTTPRSITTGSTSTLATLFAVKVFPARERSERKIAGTPTNFLVQAPFTPSTGVVLRQHVASALGVASPPEIDGMPADPEMPGDRPRGKAVGQKQDDAAPEDRPLRRQARPYPAFERGSIARLQPRSARQMSLRDSVGHWTCRSAVVVDSTVR